MKKLLFILIIVFSGCAAKDLDSVNKIQKEEVESIHYMTDEKVLIYKNEVNISYSIISRSENDEVICYRHNASGGLQCKWK